MPEKPTSLFISLAAGAFSTVGFSVSILAWLVLSIVPLSTKPQLVEPIPIDKKARRRSAPAALQRAPRSPSPTGLPEPSLITIPPRRRRVYFADSPSPVTPSRPSPRTNNDSAETLEPILLLSSPTTEVSPASSSSTLVHTYPTIPAPTLETCRESAVESDSSSSSSQRRSLSISRPFQPRARRSSGPEVPSPSTPEGKQPRRSSANFIPPFPFRRTATTAKGVISVSDVSTPSSGTVTASPTALPALAPSYFSRKATRRTSTPVPRTQPYAYPYFAQPPVGAGVSVDDSYLRRSPTPDLPASFTRSATVSDTESAAMGAAMLGMKTRSRKLNDKAQAALGLGRRPPALQRSLQPQPQTRSVSEGGWVAQPTPSP